MLSTAEVIAFLATADSDRSRAFYEGVLGLRLVDNDPFALVFDANGVTLRISKVPSVTPAPYTVLGWSVGDLVATIDGLVGQGVAFERFSVLPQDARGVWRAPGGASIAWFKDPDGNVLSLTEQP